MQKITQKNNQFQRREIFKNIYNKKLVKIKELANNVNYSWK